MSTETLISEGEYQAAIARGREAMSVPYAVRARFNSRTRMLLIKYSNGLSVGFDVRENGILAKHADADLSAPYVTPGGDGLLFEKADLAFALPSVVAAALPSELVDRRSDGVASSCQGAVSMGSAAFLSHQT